MRKEIGLAWVGTWHGLGIEIATNTAHSSTRKGHSIRIAKIIGGVIFCIGGGFTSLSQAQSALPKTPLPSTWDVVAHLAFGGDPVTTGAAIFALVSAAFAGWQAFHPAASKDDLEDSNERHGEATRIRVSDEAEATRAHMSAEIQDLKQQIAAFAETVAQSKPTEAGPFAEAANKLVDSGDDADVRRAREIVDGRSEQAADEIMAEAQAKDLRNAERYRQAARIYAITSPGKAKDAYEKATQLDPNDFSSWVELGRLRLLYENAKSAEDAFEKASELANSVQRRSLLFTEFGNLQLTKGDFQAAEEHFQSAVGINRSLAKANPDQSQFMRDWMINTNSLGTIQVQIGNLKLARDYFEKGLRLAKRLHDKNTRKAEAENDLAFAHFKIAHVAQQLGDIPSARHHLSLAQESNRALLEDDHENIELRRQLAITLEKMGNIELSVGNLSAARNCFVERNSIIGEIAQAEPRNLRWRRDQSVGQVKLARVEAAANNLDSSKEYYHSALKISKPLVSADEQNVEFRHDLFAIHASLGGLAQQEGDSAVALIHLRQAQDQISKLLVKWPNHPNFIKELRQIGQLITDIESTYRDKT